MEYMHTFTHFSSHIHTLCIIYFPKYLFTLSVYITSTYRHRLLLYNMDGMYVCRYHSYLYHCKIQNYSRSVYGYCVAKQQRVMMMQRIKCDLYINTSFEKIHIDICVAVCELYAILYAICMIVEFDLVLLLLLLTGCHDDAVN